MFLHSFIRSEVIDVVTPSELSSMHTFEKSVMMYSKFPHIRT